MKLWRNVRTDQVMASSYEPKLLFVDEEWEELAWLAKPVDLDQELTKRDNHIQELMDETFGLRKQIKSLRDQLSKERSLTKSSTSSKVNS